MSGFFTAIVRFLLGRGSGIWLFVLLAFGYFMAKD
jgi:hypothetical protein